MLKSVQALQALLLAALLLPAGFVAAHEYKAGELQIAHPWSQELPPNAPTVAAYFVIHNTGKNADRLLGVDSPIAGKAELHEHVQQGDLMKMQQVPNVAIAPGDTVTFAPMSLKKEANSIPIAPEPMTSRSVGISGGVIAWR